MEDDSFDLRPYLDAARRWWWILLLGPVVAGVVAYIGGSGEELTYRAEATVLIQSRGSNSVTPTLSDIQVSQRLVVTYRSLITKQPTLEQVAQSPDIPYTARQLAGMVRANVVQDTQLLRIVVEALEPEHAERIANTVAITFADQIRESWLASLERLQQAAEERGLISSQQIIDAQVLALENLSTILANLADSPVTSDELLAIQVQALESLTGALETLSSLADTQELFDAQLNTVGSLSIVEPATVPETAEKSSALTLGVFAVILGGMLSMLAVFLLEYFNDRIRSVEQVERTFQLPSLGVVSLWRGKSLGERGLLVAHHPHSPFVELFRQIRANFQFSVAAHSGKAFMFTSGDSGDGSTTVLSNLGIALAQDGTRVVLVDSDLRRPTMHQRFDVSNDVGLSSLLSGDEGLLDQALQPCFVEGLHVLPSGPVPFNPAELLGSAAMQWVLDALRERFDLILLDSSPLLAVVDPVVLARRADGIVLVAAANKTKTREFRNGLRKVQYAGTPIIGVLLNKVPVRGTDRLNRYFNAYGLGEQGEAVGETSGSERQQGTGAGTPLPHA